MRTTPLALKRALAYVRETHRRHPRILGGMWSIGVMVEGKLAGVAIVGRPVARMLQDETNRLEVTRVAVSEGVPNGCSKLYGACSRAAKAMGAIDLFTYTAADEPGTSLYAAGWIREVDKDGRPIEFGGKSWSRPSRHRESADSGSKHRWWAPWSQSAPRPQPEIETHAGDPR